MRLMMGHLQVFMFVNTETLKKGLISHGWRVIGSNPYKRPREKERVEQKYMFAKDRDDAFFHIERDEGGATYRAPVLLTDILTMTSPFYVFDFILDGAETMFRDSKRDRRVRLVARNYVDENRLLR